MLDKSLLKMSEAYMLRCLQGDSAHDPYHIYRVLNIAVEIAKYEVDVDMQVLLLSCLLHDIGRPAQVENPELCHAEVGARMAYDFLKESGLDEEKALAVKAAIETHRFRSKWKPKSIEAKILFDADTIDVTGAMGIARTLQYAGNSTVPLYNATANGTILLGCEVAEDSFLREYDYKLKNLYDRFYTRRGKQIAQERRVAAQQFYEALVGEITQSHTTLENVLATF